MVIETNYLQVFECFIIKHISLRFLVFVVFISSELKMQRLMWFTFGFLLGFALIVRAVQGESIGGIWWYTDKTGNDEYGNPIYSPTYQGLR